MNKTLRVLFIEDSEDDAKLLVNELKRGGFDLLHTRIDSAFTMREALETNVWDLIIADYSLPSFNGFEALNLFNEYKIDIPFIIVSGVIGEETAVKVMKAGAHDYVMKNNLTRLLPAVERELREVNVRKKSREAEELLRLSEERYRAVVENANDGIAVIQDKKFKFVNPRFVEVLGSENAININTFIEFVHPDDQQMVMNYHVSRLKGEDSPERYSFRVLDYEGNVRWVEINLTMITWGGRPAVLAFLAEVTERKKLEEEKFRMEKLEALSILAGSIANDFKDILSSLPTKVSMAIMFLESGEKGKVLSMLTEAEKISLRTRELNQQLLTFSKGGTPLKKVSSIGALVENYAGSALSSFTVLCEFAIPDSIWPVDVDEEQIGRVVQNLVINASQAMPEGGTIKIMSENIVISEKNKKLPLPGGRYVKVSVIDDGPGISKENLSKIFEPFFSTKLKGAGLGLAASYAIIRRHKGHITVDVNKEGGTTFSFFLPAAKKDIFIEEKSTEKEEMGKVNVMRC